MKSSRLECGGCGYSGRWLLHSFRHLRLCVNCVLKSHPGYFCPICLNVFDTTPTTTDTTSSPLPPLLRCVKCPSACHLSCTSSSSSATSFLCPPCSNPNLAFFQVNLDVMDDVSAKALVAAAKITSFSMINAAAMARIEAERRVEEAALAKKRAREALDMLLYLASDTDEKDHSQSLNQVKNLVAGCNHLSWNAD